MKFLSISIFLLSFVFFYISCGKTEDETKTSSTDNSSNSDNQTREYFCNNKIKIDGNNLDWNGIDSIMTDNSNDAGNYNSLDIKELFLTYDNKHACLRMDRMGIQIPSGEYLNFWIYFNAYSKGGKSFAVSVFHGSNQQVNPILWDTTGTSNYDQYTRLDENIFYDTSTSSMELAWSLENISKNSKYIISFFTHHTDNKTWYHNGDWSDSNIVFSFLPEIISTLPSNNDSSVNVSDNISITFSKSMDNLSITTNIYDNNCTGTIQISSDNFSTCIQMLSNPKSSNSKKTFTLSPIDNLSYSTNYKIRVRKEVKDTMGQYLLNQFETLNGFTTKMCNPTCTGLVAHYTFNGNSLNSTLDNYHATTKDNSTKPSLVSDRNGKPYSSYKFDGTDDYLVVDNASALKIENNSFSFVSWFSIDGFNDYSYTGSDGRKWAGSLIFASDLNNMTNLGFGRWNDMEDKTGMYSFVVDNATTWHTNYIEKYLHIAGVFDKDTKKISYYVYGKKKEEKEWEGTYILPITKFHFGSNASKNNYTNIKIDDFQIYNKALSQTEVIELYQSSSYDKYSPTITSTSPSDNDSSFLLTDNISITFSETMDNSTINTSDTSCSGTFQVSSDNFSTCVQMSSSPSVSNSNKTFTFDPSDNLSYSTTYNIRVTTGVRDVSGNQMESPYETTSGFTTQSQYETTSVTSTSPSDNDSSVSVSDNISITFSETIDNSTLTTNTSDTSCSGTFQISSDNFSTCVQMSSSHSVSNSNKTFTFDPSDNLSYSTTYEIRVTTEVKDVSGNNMKSDYKSTNGFYTKFSDSGIFVVVGNDGIILSSSDGQSWTSNTSGTKSHFWGITYGKGTFLVVGGQGTILTSTDTKSWISRSSGTTAGIYEISYGNQIFVNVGPLGRTYYSNNTLLWTQRISVTGESLWGINYINNLFVSAGVNGAIVTSVDGISWTTRVSGTSNTLWGINYGKEKYVIVGKYGTILTSNDSITWELVNSNTSLGLSDVIFDNKKFVAVGDNGTILTSTDGNNWSSISSGTNNHLWGVAYGNGIYVAVGPSGTLLTSINGHEWASKNTGIGSSLNRVFFAQ